MSFLKRVAALGLVLALCLTPALADGTPGFSQTVPYAGFSDVTGRWSEPYIRTCVEFGLMEGNGSGFAPLAQLTQGELAAIAVRIHVTLNGTAYPAPTQPWYQGPVDYLAGLGVTVSAPKAYASRETFVKLLAAVVPATLLTPINTITTLPDTADAKVLAFYNAGILTGMDAFGTFRGQSTLTREECAAMCARLAQPTLRRNFVPAGQVPAGALAPKTVVLTINGTPVTYGEYEELLLSLAREIQDMYLDNGLLFVWDGKYGEDWDTYFRTATLHSLTAKYIGIQQAAKLGCAQEALALTLFGTPTQAELAASAKANKLDLTQPDQKELATELVLEEKLNAQLALWVEEAVVVETKEYQGIDPLAICQERLPTA